MSRFVNSKIEKQTIYEIFRACRLCGAGGGYKMPIIQNVVDLDDTDIELKQKIRECVQIEVDADDKMPPLICELCIDKVNDFYEFLEMCRQTNKRTRLRLGLPPQRLPKGAPDAGDCILGVTEPVFVHSDSEDEPLSQSKRAKKGKKEPPKKNVRSLSNDNRSTSTKEDRPKKRVRSPTPPRRVTRHQAEDESKSTRSKSDRIKKPFEISKPPAKGILKKETKKDKKNDDELVLSPRSSKKRQLEKEPVKISPAKRVKITTPKPSPKVKRPPTPEVHECGVCGSKFKTGVALRNHVRSHTPTFTSNKNACNSCLDWFSSTEEANAHHKRHRYNNPYICRGCAETFVQNNVYNDHIETCLPYKQVPDIKCDDCWQTYATVNLKDKHKCPGVDGRRGGKCSKCKKMYGLLKNLLKHESGCTYRRKGELIISEEIQKVLTDFEVRTCKCDKILNEINGHYNVANIETPYGLDPSRTYPFKYLRIKSEPYDRMVNISNDALDFVHWDSDYTTENDSDIDSESEKIKKVYDLSTLALKVIFSNKFLGKLPRKKRKKLLKSEFDSVPNNEDVNADISDIISNLDKSWDEDFVGFGDKDSINKDISDESAKDVNLEDRSSLENAEEENEEKNEEVENSERIDDNILEDISSLKNVEKENEEMNEEENSERIDDFNNSDDRSTLKNVEEQNEKKNEEVESSKRLEDEKEDRQDVDTESVLDNSNKKPDLDINEETSVDDFSKTDFNLQESQTFTEDFFGESKDSVDDDNLITPSDLVDDVSDLKTQNDSTSDIPDVNGDSHKVDEIPTESDLCKTSPVKEKEVSYFDKEVNEERKEEAEERKEDTEERKEDTEERKEDTEERIKETEESNILNDIDIETDKTIEISKNSEVRQSEEELNVNEDLLNHKEDVEDIKESMNEEKEDINKVLEDKSENDLSNKESENTDVIINKEHKENGISNDEIDDKKLMEELDAQIGANDEKSIDNSLIAGNDEKSIENTLIAGNDENSLENAHKLKGNEKKYDSLQLDNISDEEFNFD